MKEDHARQFIARATLDELRELATLAATLDVYPDECCDACGNGDFKGEDHHPECEFLPWLRVDAILAAIAERFPAAPVDDELARFRRARDEVTDPRD